MKKQHILLAAVVTEIWGFNFSVIKVGFKSGASLILSGTRTALSALPAVFFLKRRQALVLGGGLWGVAGLGIKDGVAGALIVAGLAVGLYGKWLAESGIATRLPSVSWAD
ncbi:EamA family transporter [Streptomyces malaysiensis]|uniref:hypothetical protein n=1 Tax=Streptomyces malaysiensis TaxID=92644 RepID=UPI003710C482